jgi:hypothetical protein
VGLVIRENRENFDNMKFHDFFSWGRPSALSDLGRVGLVIQENREKIDNMKFRDFSSMDRSTGSEAT